MTVSRIGLWFIPMSCCELRSSLVWWIRAIQYYTQTIYSYTMKPRATWSFYLPCIWTVSWFLLQKRLHQSNKLSAMMYYVKYANKVVTLPPLPYAGPCFQFRCKTLHQPLKHWFCRVVSLSLRISALMHIWIYQDAYECRWIYLHLYNIWLKCVLGMSNQKLYCICAV